MHTIQATHLSKSFGQTQAVKDVSFATDRGEIFGLLGPNGAGKTTTIRMILDILRPDRGTVSILDGPMTEEKKNRIGYMPEERGLYQEIPLEKCLVYLSTLKGVPAPEARQRVRAYLERFDLDQNRNGKVKELSKGMQQKAQLIATIAHRPELIIIDEPFTALDPINTQMVKEVLRELRDQGTTIIMSTHQMHQVEEMCDRILLIDQGSNVLYGNLDSIRRQFVGRGVLVQTMGDLPHLEGVEAVISDNHISQLKLLDGYTPQVILRDLVSQGADVQHFEVALLSLDEIFIQVVQEGGM